MESERILAYDPRVCGSGKKGSGPLGSRGSNPDGLVEPCLSPLVRTRALKSNFWLQRGSGKG